MDSDSETGKPSSSDILDDVSAWLSSMAGQTSFPNEYENAGFVSSILLRDMELDHAEEGHFVFSLPVSDLLLNKYNTLHGGATAALVNLAASASVLSCTGKSKTIYTSDINITYISAAFFKDVVEVAAKVLRIGRNLAMCTVDIRKKNTKDLVAQGRVTHVLEPAKSLKTIPFSKDGLRSKI